MSILSEYHNKTVQDGHADDRRADFEDAAGERYDFARDCAIDVLVACGLMCDDEDNLGRAHEDDVQTLLTLALFRSDNLRNTMQHLLESGAL